MKYTIKNTIVFYFSHDTTKTMIETLKFFYAMILFLYLFLITTDVGGCKPCFHPFRISFFASQFLHNFLSCFSNIILLYFFTVAYYGCETDADCPRSMNKDFYLKCIDKKCEWTTKI